MPHEGYFQDWMGEREQKYCACAFHVAAKQSPECLRSRAWGKTVDGYRCYNPWAICNASVGGGPRRCVPFTNLDVLPDDEIFAIAAYRERDLKRMGLLDPKKHVENVSIRRLRQMLSIWQREERKKEHLYSSLQATRPRLWDREMVDF